MVERQQSKFNNCYTTCIENILEIEQDTLTCIHDLDSDTWWKETNEELRQVSGHSILEMPISTMFEAKFYTGFEGYWIASLPSLNIVTKMHSIIMKGDYVAFDPSPKKTYEKGTHMSDIEVKYITFLLPEHT